MENVKALQLFIYNHYTIEQLRRPSNIGQQDELYLAEIIIDFCAELNGCNMYLNNIENCVEHFYYHCSRKEGIKIDSTKFKEAEESFINEIMHLTNIQELSAQFIACIVYSFLNSNLYLNYSEPPIESKGIIKNLIAKYLEHNTTDTLH